VKVTIVLPWLSYGGGTRVAAIYADALRRRGHEVFVISTPKKVPSFRRRVGSLLGGRGWPTSGRHQPSHFDDMAVEHRVVDRFRAIVDDDVPNADVVVATWWETAEWVGALSRSKGKKAYFLQHYEVHESQPGDRVRATWRLPMHKIVVAEWLADVARDEFGDHEVSVVANAVDPQLFQAEVRGKQQRPTVGFMFSTTVWKGCANTIEACRLAAKRLGDLRVLCFGVMTPTKELLLPEGAEFFFQPSQDIIREIYASCDAWLFGSLREGFGLPILEAMACRTPVIGTPVGAAPELLSDGRGEIVRLNDPADMARAIESVCLMEEGKWRSMSDVVHERATSYTWVDAADRFEEALKVAVSRNCQD